MRLRHVPALTLLCVGGGAAAQTIIVSPRPDQVAVTVYREPGGGTMNLDWLNGFALISETRRLSLPAGDSEVRFEGVAGGLLPQSAVVDGLGTGVIEKNRAAKLLSPGTLLGASLGRRVHLRRTARATGAVREQEAVIRAAGDGVVIETGDGIEALRCTGLRETLLPAQVPATLSARPTLSVRYRAERPVEAIVRLSYLSSGFDWRAHYVATLGPDGRTMSLFAWLTLANGDATGFSQAETMAVAGRLYRDDVRAEPADVRPISLNCWPGQRTHQIPPDEVFVGARIAGAPPPPPPPPPSPERGGDEESIVVTGSRIVAQRENLGDLKLYRIPIPVSVASRSQKQVALLEQPAVRIESLYRWRTFFTSETGGAAERASRVLRAYNRTTDGLGLPLPAGSFTLYDRRDGRPFLLGEGVMTDRAAGEKVEVAIDSPGLNVTQRAIDSDHGKDRVTEITVRNDMPAAAPFELELAGDQTLRRSSERLTRRDGAYRWIVTVPANGSRTLTVRYREAD